MENDTFFGKGKEQELSRGEFSTDPQLMCYNMRITYFFICVPEIFEIICQRGKSDLIEVCT